MVMDYLRSLPDSCKQLIFDGGYLDKPSAQQALKGTLNAVRASVALSQVQSNMAKVMFLQAFLTGRPLQSSIDEVDSWAKRRQVELQKADPDPQWSQPLPPSAHICDVLYEQFVAGLPAEQPCRTSQHGGHDVGGIVKEPFRPMHVFWQYSNPKTQLFWVRGLDAVKIRAMKGKCLLCNTDQHRLYACPMRQEAFKKKQFYAYNRPSTK